MKIGILTLPLHTNYGGILQAYALQSTLEKMGHEVKVIDRNISNLHINPIKAPLIYAKRIFCNILGKKMPILYEKKNNERARKERRYTDIFINRYINRIIIDNYSSISRSDFDAIIVGSDQVWRPKYFGKIENAYLKFTKNWNIKRIAYAASFGSENWEYTKLQTRRCYKLIHKFNAVSVREASGIQLCKNYFDINATLVLDPTMLLNREKYVQLTNNQKQSNIPSKILMYYILDPSTDKLNLINNLAQKTGLEIFKTNEISKGIDNNEEIKTQPPVEQWIQSFMNAELIITDSFHACVFSIIFKKQFFVIANNKRGISRINNLLNIFNLEDRLILSDDIDLTKQIDYNKIDTLIDKYRSISIEFLHQALL